MLQLADHPRWVVAQTHPLCEQRATRHIVRQGGDVFAPFFYDTRLGRTLRLFPGYLFVHIVGTANWLQNTMGVLRVIAMGQRACEVPPAVVDAYAMLADERGVLILPSEAWPAGQRVRITEGPLIDCVGVVEGMDTQQRVAVLLQLLGRESRVHCPVTMLAAV